MKVTSPRVKILPFRVWGLQKHTHPWAVPRVRSASTDFGVISRSLKSLDEGFCHPKPFKERFDTRGFTLLEILIAVAILASSFLALLSSQGSSFLASERAERLTQATFLARQKMADLEIQLSEEMDKGKFPDEKEETGEFDEPYNDFRWKVSFKKVEIPLAGGEGEEGAMVGGYIQTIMDQISQGVRELKLTIFWGDPGKPEEEQERVVVTTHLVQLK